MNAPTTAPAPVRSDPATEAWRAPSITPASAAGRSFAVSFGPTVLLDLALGASVALVTAGAWRRGAALARLAALGSVAAWAYVLGIRPWHLRWGATDEEARQPLPGDDLLPRPAVESTRAITIRAPAAAVWPWLVQMGQGRGGLYSYDWLENLAGLDIHSVDRIVPELQDLAVGDAILLSGDGAANLTVAAVLPERALVLRVGAAGDPFAVSWAFVLRPIDEATVRLIARFRADSRPRRTITLLYAWLVEIPHFIMERAMLLGIKARAERLTGEGRTHPVQPAR